MMVEKKPLSIMEHLLWHLLLESVQGVCAAIAGEVGSGAMRKHKNWEQLKFPQQKVGGVCQGWCERPEGADRDSCRYL